MQVARRQQAAPFNSRANTGRDTTWVIGRFPWRVKRAFEFPLLDIRRSPYAFDARDPAALRWRQMEPVATSTAPAPPTDAGERLAAEFVYHDKAAPATVNVKQHGRPDRMRRAAKAWAGCWGAA